MFNALHPGRPHTLPVGVPPNFPMGAQPASRMAMGPPTQVPFSAERVVNQTIGWTSNARTTWASVVQPDAEKRIARFMPGELLFMGKLGKKKFASPSSVAMFDIYGLNKYLSSGGAYRVSGSPDYREYNHYGRREERARLVRKFLDEYAFEGVLINGTAATDGDEDRVGDRLVNLVVRGHALTSNVWGFPLPTRTQLYFGVYVPNPLERPDENSAANNQLPNVIVAPVHTREQCDHVLLCGGALIPIGFVESFQPGEGRKERESPYISDNAARAMDADGAAPFLPRLDVTLDIRPAILPWM